MSVYRNRWMSVREDRVEGSDGAPGLYGVVDKPDFALIVPRERDGFWMVEQYRYPVRRRAWEFPQGSWDATAGSPVDLARAELAEETGLRARQLRPLGRLYAAYGFCSQGFDVFLASGLEPGEPVREATERDMVHGFVPDDEFVRMVERGAIVDAATIAAYALLRLGLLPTYEVEVKFGLGVIAGRVGWLAGHLTTSRSWWARCRGRCLSPSPGPT